MITLILNAAEGRVQFVIQENEGDGPARILCHTVLDAPSRGTELLPPALDAALRGQGLRPEAVQRVACVHGPGSFTGIRLVLAFAAAYRRAVGATLGGINYLEAIAASLPRMPGLPQRRRVLTHARRDLVHRQDFMLGNGGIRPVTEPELAELELALDDLNTLTEPVLLMGSGYERNRAVLHEMPGVREGLVLPVPGADQPSAQALSLLARRATYAAADLEPLYLRPCDAVDNLPHIASKRGQSPEEARERLECLLGQPPAPLE